MLACIRAPQWGRRLGAQRPPESKDIQSSPDARCCPERSAGGALRRREGGIFVSRSSCGPPMRAPPQELADRLLDSGRVSEVCCGGAHAPSRCGHAPSKILQRAPQYGRAKVPFLYSWGLAWLQERSLCCAAGALWAQPRNVPAWHAGACRGTDPTRARTGALKYGTTRRRSSTVLPA